MKNSVPNIVSMFRVLVTPFFFIYVLSDDPELVQTACFLFLLGAVSDFFDGWFARKYEAVTAWGKFFDPLADKFLTTAAFLAFVLKGIVPLWMVVVILIRDFGTTFLRILAESRNQSVKTSFSAKTKTMLQMVFIALVLALLFFKNVKLFKEWIPTIDTVLYSSMMQVIMLALTVLTVWTLIDYILEFNKTKSAGNG